MDNMIGQKFGKLLVESESHRVPDKGIYYHCKCDCGNDDVVVLGIYLRNGHTKSCGCLSKQVALENIERHRGCRKIDLVGQRFGRLEVIEFSHSENGNLYWKCKCDCDNIITARGSHLRDGDISSCGCLAREISSKIHTTHGMSYTRFYRIFGGIKRRCNNINCDRYKDYGGRGIQCLWGSFEEFYKDMYESYKKHCDEYGEKQTTIDRIDNDGNYCKENCRWSTPKEQSINRRKHRGN